MDLLSLYQKYCKLYPAGSILFREGDIGRDMYIIQSGKVQITRQVGGQEAVLAVLPAGEFFGEMAILNNCPRTATASVVEDSMMLVLDGMTFEAMIRGSSEIAVRFIKRLADRLGQANRQIEMLLYKEPNHKVVCFLRGEAATSGQPHAAGTAIKITEEELANRVGLAVDDVRQVIERLIRARLLARNDDGSGFIIFEVGRLQDFLDFLEMKERFSR
jgi:CRP/FNR family transcriptional regulator, cyclic AMP receptor protein